MKDLMPGIHCFRTKIIKETDIGGGRKHREYQGVSYISTPTGEIEEKEWAMAAETAAIAEGKQELLQEIMDHCKIHCVWLKTDDDLKLHALECLYHEAYKSWKDFGYE